MTLNEIIERKKEEFEEMNRKCDGAYGIGKFPPEVKSFLEKAIRESVEEALREVSPEGHVEEEVGFNDCLKDYNQRIKEFMK